MSSNLTAEPTNRKKLSLGSSLKFILRKRYGEPINTVIDNRDFDYLDALIDTDVEGAKTLKEYIEKHGEVYLKEEY